MYEAFEHSCYVATKAALTQHRYWVKFLDEGGYKTFSTLEPDTTPELPGLIVPIPTLKPEWFTPDPFFCFYDDAENEMLDNFNQALKVLITSKNS